MALSLSAVAAADWNVGDPYKMHYPQLPDPNGWDVKAVPPLTVADDFRCTETGPILDLHFWGSWRGDQVGLVKGIGVSFWEDDPVGPGGYFPDNQYSMPLYKFQDPPGTGNYVNGERWHQVFTPGEFTMRPWGTGNQGWFDPSIQQYVSNDHQGIYQYNIRVAANPFIQEAGKIYWVSIQMELDPQSPATAQWGWKTSISPHFGDDAVYYDSLIAVPPGYPHADWLRPDWRELRDPVTGESLDLAFVITPEPATLMLLGLGGVALSRRRR
jgi:hypothetical protein